MRLIRPSGRPPGEEDEWFRSLYDDTSPDLLAFLLRRCRSAEDAADCLAETYRIAWEKRSSVPAGDDARPWLFGVARNVMRRALVRDERSAAASRELCLAIKRLGAVPEPDDGALQAALAELSELDREIVVMLAWDGLRPREVAVILGLSPNVVRVRAHRARERLRLHLGSAMYR